MAATLGGGKRIGSVPDSDDVQNMLSSLKSIGLKIEGSSDVVFHNSFPECEEHGGKALELAVGEGGTTARFLLALLSKGSRPYVMKLKGQLAKRPWEELIEALENAGAKVELKSEEIFVQGPVDSTLLPQTISAGRTTQFASALALAFANDGYTPTPVDVQGSWPYWNMTIDCIKRMKAPTVEIPLDWSSAAYPLVWSQVTGQKVELPGLVKDGQADSVIGDIIATHVHGKPLSVDVKDCPDLLPALVFWAVHLEGTSTFTGIKNLVFKESDRVTALVDLMGQCGVSATSSADVLQISGPLTKGTWHLSPPADHRLVMVAAMLLRAHGGGTLAHSEAVKKSFPNFFEFLGVL